MQKKKIGEVIIKMLLSMQKNIEDLNSISYMNQIKCFQICLKIVEIY